VTTVARPVHRLLDRQFADAMARDRPGDGQYRELDLARPFRTRRKDLVMDTPRSGVDARMVRLMELWERTSAKGTRYFSGFLGDAQVLMFSAGEHPDRPGVMLWRLFVQEKDPARRQQARSEPARREPELV
jgi:hypothetical protein